MDQNPDPHLANGKAGSDTNPKERLDLDPEFSKTSGSGHNKKIFKKTGKSLDPARHEMNADTILCSAPIGRGV
jgi:hypothetical protein